MKKTYYFILSIIVLTITLIFSYIKILNLTDELDYVIVENESIRKYNTNLKIQVDELKELNLDYLQQLRKIELEYQRQQYLQKEKSRIENEKNKYINYRALRDLKLRQNPNINSTVIMEIGKNSIVKIKPIGLGTYSYIKKSHPITWWKIEFKGKVGWVIFDSEIVYFNKGIPGGESLLIIQD